MNSDETPMWNDPAEAPQVRELLQAGRRADVDYDVSSGLAQHLARVNAGAPLPHWAQTGASLGTVAAWVAGPIVVASVVAAVWLSHGSAPQSPAGPAAALNSLAPIAPVITPSTQALPPSAAQAAHQPVMAPEPAVSVMHHKQARVAAKPAMRATSALAAKLDLEPKLAPSAAPRSSGPAAQASPAARVVPNGTVKTEPEVQPREAQPQEAAVEAQPKPAEMRKQADESRLEREMQMLSVAQRVLSSDPARALRLTQQGEHEFPSSMFSAEREQVGLLALVKLGRLDEARRIGQPFLAKYPNAPWSQRLRHALATGRIE
jgi:hypothetical protein